MIISTCYEYKKNRGGGSKDTSRIIQRLNSLRVVPEGLINLLEDEDKKAYPRLPTIASLVKPGGAMENYKVRLESLQKKLKPTSGWRATRDALVWPLKEREVQNAVEEIGNMCCKFF